MCQNTIKMDEIHRLFLLFFCKFEITPKWKFESLYFEFKVYIPTTSFLNVSILQLGQNQAIPTKLMISVSERSTFDQIMCDS